MNVEDEFAVDRAGRELRDRLHDAAQESLPEAYRMGKGGRSLSITDTLDVARAVQSNQNFLTSSFVPYVTGDLIDPEEQEEGGAAFVGIEANRAEAWESRLSLYDGIFWALIWAGLGSEAGDRPVRRLLDPGADHCSTCPPKAREYESFSAMIAETGGVPGDGSDQCRSNCRCSIEILSKDGGWSLAP